MPIRALIVDDEPLARERLRSLLATESDFQIVGECGNGKAALSWMTREPVDLVFLDIIMPEMNGFEVVQAIPLDRLPQIVFVTVFDTFAVKAFEVHAVDYVLKPVDPIRLKITLNHIRKRKNEGKSEVLGASQVAKVLSDSNRAERSTDRLLVKCNGEIIFLRHEDVSWVESAGNYVTLYLAGRHSLIRETLSRMELRLAPFGFAKISRSVIVNMAKIKSMKTLRFGEYAIRLMDGTELTLTRGYREVFFQNANSKKIRDVETT
jgi:two-component system LytT family response regulator